MSKLYISSVEMFRTMLSDLDTSQKHVSEPGDN